MREINLRLTVDEANLVLEGLGNLPFVKVYALIGKIQEQAGMQLQGGGTGDPADDIPPENGASTSPTIDGE